MTKVKVLRNNDNKIIRISVSDHACFAEHGQDIVCAGISAITFGGLNALCAEGLDERLIQISDGKVNVDLTTDEKIQTVARTIEMQLETIQDSYPEHIQITK